MGLIDENALKSQSKKLNFNLFGNTKNIRFLIVKLNFTISLHFVGISIQNLHKSIKKAIYHTRYKLLISKRLNNKFHSYTQLVCSLNIAF